jgi:Tfp pilus assembly PilM family ATPase
MNRRLVGLDIGHSAVRAVVVQNNGGTWRLERHETVNRRDDTGQPHSLPVVLTELDNLLNLSDKTVCVSSSELNALVRFISTIPMPPDRLTRLLRLELAQHAGSDGELAADTMSVPLSGDELIHCCVLAQPPQVYELLRDLSAARIVPDRVHFGAAAVYNATLPSLPVEGNELALLIDIGAATTRVALLGEGRLLACRQLGIGGDAFTEALQKEHGLEFEAAEQMKLKAVAPMPKPKPPEKLFEKTIPKAASSWISEAIAKTPGMKTPPPGSVAENSEGDLFIIDDDGSSGHHPAAGGKTPPIAKIPSKSAAPAGPVSAYDRIPTPRDGIVMPESQAIHPDLVKVADALYAQIASTHTWFKAQLHSDKIDFTRILLSGGGSELSGLAPYLANRFHLAVEFFDPFAGFEGQLPQHPEEYVTALGLAVTNLPNAAKIDLFPEKMQRKRQMLKQLIWPYVAAACVVLAVLFTTLTWSHQHGVEEENLNAYNAYKSEYDSQKKQLDDLESEKERLSNDLHAIASRIYAGRDLLYTIRALKEQAPQNPELWVTKLETVGISKDDSKFLPPGTTADADATIIQRGAVNITGQVKFAKGKESSEVDPYFVKYKDLMENWQPDAGGQKLFSFILIEGHSSIGQSAQQKAEGKYPFEIKCYFQPTQLSQITSVVADAPQEP